MKNSYILLKNNLNYQCYIVKKQTKETLQIQKMAYPK